ncbi:hypothetical protein MMC22_006146 [Lobaria immixta]|nr:hypothetical protein [Lobaria immixta]
MRNPHPAQFIAIRMPSIEMTHQLEFGPSYRSDLFAQPEPTILKNNGQLNSLKRVSSIPLSYVYRSGVDPVYLKPDVENKLGGLTPGASVVFILNGFNSGCLAISQWEQYARKKALVNIYIAIRTSIQKAQDAPRGVWSAPIPGRTASASKNSVTIFFVAKLLAEIGYVTKSYEYARLDLPCPAVRKIFRQFSTFTVGAIGNSLATSAELVPLRINRKVPYHWEASVDKFN